jgi:hypothetical protein
MLAVGLSGCGSASHASGSTATSATSAVASSPSSHAAPTSTARGQVSTPSATAHAIDVCATLSAAAAANLSDQAITTADAQNGLQPKEYGCAYGNADDSLQVEVTVFEHDAAFTYNTFSSGSAGATTVSGLGDKAFFDNDGTMYVLAGSNLIQVNGLKTADECAALARPVVAAL